MWRFVLRYFGSNEELIKRLSETYPIRRIARVIADIIVRGKDASKGITQDAGLKPEHIETLKNVDYRSLFQRIVAVVKEDLKQIKSDVKDLKDSFPKQK